MSFIRAPQTFYESICGIFATWIPPFSFLSPRKPTPTAPWAIAHRPMGDRPPHRGRWEWTEWGRVGRRAAFGCLLVECAWAFRFLAACHLGSFLAEKFGQYAAKIEGVNLQIAWCLAWNWQILGVFFRGRKKNSTFAALNKVHLFNSLANDLPIEDQPTDWFSPCLHYSPEGLHL